jgi:tRNA threonylcarbamoyl adenosine modification protein YeaZ
MMLLALDTAANLCAACLCDPAGGHVLSRQVEDVGRGHAERLMDLVGAAMSEAGVGWSDISRIAVCVGPGSFTGTRIGVAAARGLALALSRPAVGVSSLEGLAAEARDHWPGRAVLAAIDARNREIFAVLYDEAGGEVLSPALISCEAAAGLAAKHQPVIAGSAAGILIDLAGPLDVAGCGRTADIAIYARLAAGRLPAGKPRPLYLRGSGAASQASYALPRQEA